MLKVSVETGFPTQDILTKPELEIQNGGTVSLIYGLFVVISETIIRNF